MGPTVTAREAGAGPRPPRRARAWLGLLCWFVCSGSAPAGDEVQQVLQQARQLRTSGQAAEAAALLQPLAGREPAVTGLLGLCLLEAGEAGRASTLAERLQGYRGDDQQVYTFLGRLAEQQGRLEVAAEAFRTATRIAPDAVEPLVHLVSLEMRAGRLGRALKNAERLQQASPELGRALTAQVLAAQARRFQAQGVDMTPFALEKLRQACALVPADQALRVELLDTLVGSSALEEARTVVRTAFASSEARIERLYWEGQIADAAQQADEARARYAEALALDPGHGPAALALARLHIVEGDPGPALPLLEAARSATGDDARAARLLGEALDELGQQEEAVSWLRRSDGLAPDNPKTLYLLGRLLVRLGQGQEGQRLLERVAELGAPPPALDREERRRRRADEDG